MSFLPIDSTNVDGVQKKKNVYIHTDLSVNGVVCLAFQMGLKSQTDLRHRGAADSLTCLFVLSYKICCNSLFCVFSPHRLISKRPSSKKNRSPLPSMLQREMSKCDHVWKEA